MSNITNDSINLLLGGDGLPNVLENLAEAMKADAIRSARLMSIQALQGDANRNHVNHGRVSQALKVLRLLGYETDDATWQDGAYLICEKITINGKDVFKR